MAIGDKRPVVMQSDRAVPSGIATLDSVGNVPFEQLGNVVRPNLLDNAYFVNPVNQRGQTEYTGAGYTIDRWTKTGEPVVTLTADGLKLSSASQYQWFNTILEHDLTGKQVTLSVLYSDGVLQSGSTVVSSAAESLFYRNNWFLRVSVNNGKTEVHFFNGGSGEIVVTAIKLELGSTQTLAHQDADGNWVLNEIPNYGEELAKCQRDQVELKYLRVPGVLYGNYVRINIPTPVTLRKNPIVTISDSIYIYHSSGFYQIDNPELLNVTATSNGVSAEIQNVNVDGMQGVVVQMDNVFMDAN